MRFLALLCSVSAYDLVGFTASGLEYGMGPNGPLFAEAIPGRLENYDVNKALPVAGTGQRFFKPATTSLQTLISKGANTIRIPFAWERLVPNMPVALNGGAVTLNTTYAAYIDQTVLTVTNAGAFAILDLHNYARYNFRGVSAGLASSVLGGGVLKAEHLAATWKAIAARYRANPKVIYSIMHEPYDMPDGGTTYMNGAIDAIAAIRTLSTQMVLVSGVDWATGWGFSWNSAQVIQPLVARNFSNVVIDMHHYFDFKVGPGPHTACGATDFASQFDATTAWLAANNQKAFIGEIGVTSACTPVMKNLLTYLSTKPQWIGLAYFSAGPGWDKVYPDLYVEKAGGFIGGVQLETVVAFSPKVGSVTPAPAHAPVPAPSPTPAPSPSPIPAPAPPAPAPPAPAPVTSNFQLTGVNVNGSIN